MELDPIEVLHHLNALGYENVEPHLLRKFMKDLKKLIKYEKQKSQGDIKKEKCIASDNQCKNVCHNKKNDDVFERLSQPSLKTKLCSKAVSTIGVQTDLQNKDNNKYSQILKRKKMDPVSLYQYYNTEWQAHKLPGEKNHNQLRWQVRQQMMPK